MPYIMLALGTVGLTLIWVVYARRRAEYKADLRTWAENPPKSLRISQDQGTRTMWSVVGTVAILLAMWFWGYQAIVEANEVAAKEQQWLLTFSDEHRRAWVEDCEYLFERFGEEIVFDGDSGTPISKQQCIASWYPPELPSSYTTDKYSQPDRVEPRANQAIFGEDLFRWVCTSRGDCYSWDDFVSPPIEVYNMDPPPNYYN